MTQPITQPTKSYTINHLPINSAAADATPSATTVLEPPPTMPIVYSDTSNSSPVLIAGINYLSNGNRWAMSSAVLNADFAKFAADGIRYLCIRVLWSVMEPTYNSSYCALDPTALGNLQRVLNAAQANGIQVVIVFWTHFQNVHWDMPSYITNIFNLLDVDKPKYLRYLQAMVTELSGYSCIEGWTVLNEPFYNTKAQRAPMEQLIADCVSAVKAVDTRPVLCRFTLSYTPASGKFSTSLYDLFDIFVFNIYLDPLNQTNTIYNSNWSQYEKLVSDIGARGKTLWVTEFGDANTDTEHVRVHYEYSLAKFNEDGIKRAYAWAWQSGSPQNERFNICTGSVSPKPAYYELLNYTSLPASYFSLMVACSLGDCTIPSPGTYTYQEDGIVQVSALQVTGYNFKQWLLDAQTQLTDATITIKMDKNHAIEAVFEHNDQQTFDTSSI